MPQLSLFDAVGNPKPKKRLFLLGCAYDGQKGKAYLKLLDTKTGEVILWYDNTDHKPYCFTNIPLERLENNEALKQAGAVAFEHVEKYDAISDGKITMTKIIASDPLAVGGSKKSIREQIDCWEADIPYHLNYLFDNQLIPSLIYAADENGTLTPELADDNVVDEILKRFFKTVSEQEAEELRKWLKILEAEQPRIEFIALDIEIIGESATRVPSPSHPEDRVAAISLASSDGLNLVLLLGKAQQGVENPTEFKIEYFDNEQAMLRRCFEIIEKYPIIVTFNGDDFDLPYLKNRGEKLGIEREKIPIMLGREGATLRTGIHLDLYRFFMNKSIQIYAFDNRYREHTLEGVATALLGVGKVPLTKTLAELTPLELAEYSYRDAKLLHDLITMNDRLVLRLIAVIARIGRTPMEDVCRHGVSGWIKNLLYWEHRRMNWIIPRKEDLLQVKGQVSTKAVIDGKKYRGAIVVDPIPGIHFGVIVLDFASLYPSVLKEANLSYETVRCPHEECKDNLIPETDHWVCRKKRGIQSLIIGSLRDIRVSWYKVKAGDKSLDAEQRSWYGVVQRALKVFLNASYGVFGFEEFPLYCPPVAEGVAAVGRYVFKQAIEKAKALGIQVIYGDTDSIFLKTDKPELIEEVVKWAKSTFNLDLEFDKTYVYVVFSRRKKNYLGVTDKGVVDVKGLTGKKRNIPVFIKEAFDDVLRQLSEVKSEEDLERVKANIRNSISTWYRRLKNRELDIEQLAFRVMLSKTPERYEKTTPPHVKAARKLQQNNIKVVAGDIISYVKTKDKDGVAPVQFARLENIDVDKYIEYMRSTFEQILDPLEIEFDSIIGVSSLESFL